jgi:hypothetical protein
VLAGGLAALLAGCGQDSDAGGSPSPASFVLEHQYGSTTIPASPKRVVTMTGSWTDALIALNVPILAEYVTTGYSGPGNRFAWTPEHESQLIEMTTVAEISIEKLAGLQPDLILVGYVGDKATYEKLAAVAPTVPVMDAKAVLDSWQDVTTTAGRIFGHDEQAKQLVDRVPFGASGPALFQIADRAGAEAGLFCEVALRHAGVLATCPQQLAEGLGVPLGVPAAGHVLLRPSGHSEKLTDRGEQQMT